MKESIIIGVVGLSGAGKNTVAEEILPKKYGATYISLTEKVKEYIASLGNPNSTRAERIAWANELRQKEGNGVFMQRAFDDIHNATSSLVVINDVYHPDEIRALKEAFATSVVHIIGVIADEQIRFERMIKRNRPGDPTTFEEFRTNDLLNRGGNGKSYGQKLDACIQEASYVIDNSGTYGELLENIATVHEKITANSAL